MYPQCMDLKVFRFLEFHTETFGMMTVDGKHHSFTLEDEYRKIKLANETRIAAGRYQIKLRTEGKMNQRYIERFPDSHRGMLWLQDVPKFKYVYLHIGNTEKHTSGCILVGYGMAHIPTQGSGLTYSTPAYLSLANKIYAALDTGDEVWIEVVD